MESIERTSSDLVSRFVTRRRFLQTTACGVFTLGLGSNLGFAGAVGASAPRTVLSGTEFDLRIGAAPLNITGRERVGTLVNGQLPAPLLRWREGDVVTLRVSNGLPVRSSIHWHGLIVPADMDGVPGISFEGIPSGGTYVYRFKVNQSGTYWYHAHSRFQEQTGLYGPIIVDRRAGERYHADREYVVMLSDWSDTDPERIYSVLKKHSDYFNFGKRTLADFFADSREKGLDATFAERQMWGQMRMDPTDLQDVSGYAYTYLMNGSAPLQNWTGLFSHGERVRLRFINGSAMTIFDVRIPGLKLTVVAADGQDVEPVTVDEFRISAAETYDVIVEPSDDRAYTIFAQSMDRSGYARGTLTPRPGLEAEVPRLDPRPLLTMADMGMAHGASHGDHETGAQTANAATDSSPQHSGHYAELGGHANHSVPGSPLRHPSTERSTTVDTQAQHIRTALDDPGIGLRDNGRRVLSYADLHTIGGPIDRRAPAREIELHLTGHMERFMWSFNGQKFSEAEPLRFTHGERLRITLVNDSMMTHPIHLHGMWSEIETPDGEFQVRKHTVNVQPAQRISYAVTADALGRWAYHCHLLYHMEAGMFREVEVVHDGGQQGTHHEHT